MRTPLRALIEKLARQELDWQGRALLAPVVAPGRARVRVQGLLHTLKILPEDYRGFGVFAMKGEGLAEFVRSATARERSQYLQLWPKVQLRLLKEIQPGDWWAHPVAGQCQGLTTGGPPLVVHEVSQGSCFELVQAAHDGANLWYDQTVLNARLQLAEQMREQLRQAVPPEELRMVGLTPADRAAYARLYRPPQRVTMVENDDERRLSQALERGGGQLESFSRQADSFQVTWKDGLGIRRFSSVHRDDLSVVSSGICLSGRDADFDLTSLVGVIEEGEEQ
jgi:hypothetical protein